MTDADAALETLRPRGVAIVTGASSGIGAHLASLLADLGMTVIAAARRGDRLAELSASHERIIAQQCDVSVDDDVEALVDVAASHGDVAVVVNNAGISDGSTPAEAEPLEQFRGVVDVNLTATFALSASVARHMIASGSGGSIINIASIHAFVAASPNNSAAYVASKAAVVGLTKELAAQWARHGIRVNSVAPGYFASELTEDLFSSDRGVQFVERNTLLRRSGELAELNGPVMLLASDAGSYITGQTLIVDGGWTTR